MKKPTKAEILAKQTNRNNYLKRTYDLSSEAVKLMLVTQGHRCAICKKPFVKDNFHVDHCHNSGKVRGLLCGNCNVGLGFFKDDVGFLQAAIDYLNLKKQMKLY